MKLFQSSADVLARTVLVIFLLAMVPASSWSHGGEDHSGTEAPAPSTHMAPRATAQSEEFELVAVLNGSTLTVMLDRFATNAPVPDAQIEIESGSALKAIAKQVSPGTYVVQSDVFRTPAKYPLAFSVQVGDNADLLAATLDLTAPVVGAALTHAPAEWAKWGASGAVLLVGGVLLAVRRRRTVDTRSV